MKLSVVYFTIFLLLPIYLLAEDPAVRTVGVPYPLTEEGNYYISPVWSPEGDKVAVTSHNYGGIWIISFPDGNITELTAEPASGFGLAWSSNGEKIVTRVSRFENRRRYNALAVFDVSSGERTQITEYFTLFPGIPRWTKNDTYVYMTGTDKFKLFSADNDNSKLDNPPDEDVVYIRKDQLKVRNLSAKNENSIVPVEGRILNLTISPDGTMMAFEVIGGDLYVCDIDGLNPVDLGIGYEPSWSPDSDKLTYMVTEDDGHRYLSADIYVINADGSGKINLTNTSDILEMHPSWSPDGKWIAYDTFDKGQIFIQEVK